MVAQVFEWIDPTGVSTTLNVAWDMDGRFMPPVTFVSDKLPGRNGEVFRHSRLEARTFRLPIYLSTSCTGTPADLRTSIRALANQMNPTRGTGKIRITNPGGDIREINCHYSGGLEVPEKYGSTVSRNLQRANLTFIAHDPFWQNTGPTVLNYDAVAGQNFFPFFPFHLSTSQIITSAFVPNPGDVPTWPIWKVYGPGSTIVLLNTDTGEKLDFSANGGLTLPSGEIMNIDTSEGVKSVRRQSDNVNLYPYLSADSVMWAIPAGGANIQLQMTGVTPGTSTLQLTFTPRYVSV